MTELAQKRRQKRIVPTTVQNLDLMRCCEPLRDHVAGVSKGAPRVQFDHQVHAGQGRRGTRIQQLGFAPFDVAPDQHLAGKPGKVLDPEQFGDLDLDAVLRGNRATALPRVRIEVEKRSPGPMATAA